MTEPAHETAEKAVMGSLLLRPLEYHTLAPNPLDYTLPDIRRALDAMVGLWAEGVRPDPISIADWTERNPGRALDSLDVADMTRHAANGIEVARAADIVVNAALDRRVRLMAQALHVSDKNGPELLAEAMTAFNTMATGTGEGAIQLTDAVGEVLAEAERRQQGEKGSQITTGTKEVDERVHLDRGGVMVIAGRPSMGKSALVLWMIDQWAQAGERVLLFSTETGSAGVARRFLAHASGLNSRHFGMGQDSAATWGKLTGAASKLHDRPIWIDDESDNAVDISRAIRLHRQRDKISVVVIDHIQECVSGDDPRVELNKLISSARSACRENPKIALVLVSQLSRRVESRENRKPQMSDLKESGKIEETADCVVMAFRPAYYADQVKQYKTESKGHLWLNVAKNRDGRIGWLRMAWNYDNGQVLGALSEKETK